jgi:hypothetical protein
VSGTERGKAAYASRPRGRLFFDAGDVLTLLSTRR